MKIKRGYKGGWYLVFESCGHADKWGWLFRGILRMRPACFGQFDNAFAIWE